MVPSVVISYVDQRKGKIPKAAFVNESDALIFWKAMDEKRHRHYVMETLDGEPVVEMAHTGINVHYGGYYSHAYAITEKNPLPPRERDRERAKRNGWEFEAIDAAGD